MSPAETKQLWIDWTHDAMSGYSKPDDIDDTEDLVNDMAEVACNYADAMLEELEERFGGGSPRKRRKKNNDDD